MGRVKIKYRDSDKRRKEGDDKNSNEKINLLGLLLHYIIQAIGQCKSIDSTGIPLV